MKIGEWFRGLMFKAALRAQAVRFIPSWIKTAWMEISFASFVTHGYKASSAVFACVRALAFSFPEPPLLVYRGTKDGETVEPEHPIRMLLRRPNSDQGEAEFMMFAVTYASIGGNVYVWKERSADGRVVALWPFSDANVAPLPGRNTTEGLVRAYEYDPGDGRKIEIPKNDIIHWKFMPDPDQPWRGMGAIQAAAKDTDSDTESSRYTYALLKNDAIPRVVITLVEGDELTPDKSARLRASWHERYGGDARGEIAFLEAGMHVERLGLNMQELDITALKDIPESRICAAFGVPPVIAGLHVGLKRSDYGDGQARKSFTETTLAALWRAFSSEMENGLAGEFGDEDIVLKYDLNAVRALQENMAELWTRIDRAVLSGYITRAEARRALGYDAQPYDDVYRETLAATWVIPAMPAPEPEPRALLPAAPPEEEPEEETPEDEEPEEDEKSRGPVETKNMVLYARSLQRIRKTTAGRMANDLDDYFRRLADRVVSRAGKAFVIPASANGGATVKDLPNADDLITPRDVNELTTLLKRWYVAIAEASWETINLSLGVTIAFELTDPAVTAALATAGDRVVQITQTTKESLRQALMYGNEQGWSIGQLVRGDDVQPGIRQIVEQTYRNRAENIARTELGTAQNYVTANRYLQGGVDKVEILDNGLDDDDSECKIASGQVWTVAYFSDHLLEHPRCTRAAAPYFGDREADRS